ncbi:MAG: ABC transporter permease, partial [Terracidiphilus sp.]
MIARLRSLLTNRQAEEDLAREVASHLTLLADDFERGGMSPEDARLAARRAYGSVERAKQAHRDERSVLWIEHAMQDLRYGLRTLSKSRGFTLTAVLTLAFGIGATTAIFSIVEGILLRPLPFADPGRLVVLGDTVPGIGMGSNGHIGVTMPQILTYERETRGFAALGGFEQASYEFSDAGAPAEISAARVTASIFPLLGVAPLIGRTFTQPEDDRSQQVTVISYAMWHSRFHADPQVLGRKIELNRKTYEIIGVMPR